MSTAEGVTSLDRVIVSAHGMRLFGRPYHPYFLLGDLGIAATVACAFLVSTHGAGRPPFSFPRFLVAFAGMQLGYVLFLRVKRQLFGIPSRSFLQDSLLFVLPSYVLLSMLVGNAVSTSLDMAGLGLPLGIAFIRVGCFLGGCCYGRPSAAGVLYPERILQPVNGLRRFTPGPVPPGRVFPLQLVESAYNAVLFTALFTWWWLDAGAVGRVLPTYLLAYSVYRIASDFFRASSVRPRRAGLTEAQWVALAVMLVCLAVTLLQGRS